MPFFLLVLSGCGGGFWAGLVDNSDIDLSKIHSIAILEIEYRRGYKNLDSGRFRKPYELILASKGYHVIGNLELRQKLRLKNIDLDEILMQGNYTALKNVADAGIIARFQENAISPPSTFTKIIDFKNGDIIWYKSMVWQRYNSFSQVPLFREFKRVFLSLPYVK